MTRYFLLFSFGIFCFFQTNAQKPVNQSAQKIEKRFIEGNKDEKLDTVIVIPEDFDSSLDYLLYSWATEKKVTTDCAERPNPEVTETQYRNRLKKLPHIIEMPYNAVVKSFINIYTADKRRQVEYMLGLSKYYFPIFEDELEAAKLPLELKYLPVIESALTPNAISRAGAGGLWQFMISTGRFYDLEINSLVDERFDPVKSTKAAVKYLKELFSIYGDWNLVLAAYNCGPGNVNKAVRRAGGKRDFWSIYPYLPHETRGYVPIFIAANYALTYYDEHNLCPAKIQFPATVDTVMINKRIHFEQIVSVLKIPLTELRHLNPQYKRDIVPGDIKPYAVCMPVNYANQFIQKLDTILAYKAEELNIRREEVLLLPPMHVKKKIVRSTLENKPRNDAFMYHTVAHGQTLGAIARIYRVTIAQIRKWNKMSPDAQIQQGQQLKIMKK